MSSISDWLTGKILTSIIWSSLNALALLCSLHSNLNSSTSGGVLFDSGVRVSLDTIRTAGLEPWLMAVTEFSQRLGSLLRDDKSSFTAITAIALVNFKTDEEGLPLQRSSDVYSMHHKFIEVLKSHCCATTMSCATTAGSSAAPTVSTSADSTSTAAASSHSSLKMPNDSTYLSRVLAEKEDARRLTRDLLLPVLLAAPRLLPGSLQLAVNLLSHQMSAPTASTTSVPGEEITPHDLQMLSTDLMPPPPPPGPPPMQPQTQALPLPSMASQVRSFQQIRQQQQEQSQVEQVKEEALLLPHNLE